MRIQHPSWFNASYITCITRARGVSFRLGGGGGGNILSAKGMRFLGGAGACFPGKFRKSELKIDNRKKKWS